MRPSVLFTAILAFLVFCSTVSEAAPRKFTSNDGKSLDAEMVEATESSVTLRRTSDGKDFTLPLDRLSEEDRNWIQEWRVRNAPAPHPLGWKRLRIHADGPGVRVGHATIIGDGMWGVEDIEEIYLPAGAWVKLAVSRKDRASLEGLVRYDGASDWYVEGSPNEIRLRTRPDGPTRVAAFEFSQSETHEGGKPLGLKECSALVEAGASISTNPQEFATLAKGNVAPQSLSLEIRKESLRWEDIPRGVQALSISSSGLSDLTGIEFLSDLQHLEIVSEKVSGIDALQKLTKLELLSVKAVVDPAQIAHLGKLTHLRHLLFLEQSKGPLPANTFDCVGELSRLESVFLGSHYASDKRVNPGKAFRNCPNLTSYRLNQASITDKGAFLEKLPNLTAASFAGGMVSRERAVKLLDAGHFKHVMNLDAPMFYPLRNLPNLQQLDTIIYPGGKNFDGIEELPSLRRLKLTGARNEDLQKLAGLPVFGKLETLSLTRPEADDFSSLREMPALRQLRIYFSDDSRTDLSALTSLESVIITACSKLAELTLPSQLIDLRVESARSLDFGAPNPLPSLRRLHVERCEALTTIAPLGPCPELTHLNLIDCQKLGSTGGLEKGPKVERSVIRGCAGIAGNE